MCFEIRGTIARPFCGRPPGVPMQQNLWQWNVASGTGATHIAIGWQLTPPPTQSLIEGKREKGIEREREREKKKTKKRKR